MQTIWNVSDHFDAVSIKVFAVRYQQC